MRIPRDWPVKPLKPGAPAKDRMTCGTCGRSWDDAIPTSYTPSPSGRCPFELFHDSTPTIVSKPLKKDAAEAKYEAMVSNLTEWKMEVISLRKALRRFTQMVEDNKLLVREENREELIDTLKQANEALG